MPLVGRKNNFLESRKTEIISNAIKIAYSKPLEMNADKKLLFSI